MLEKKLGEVHAISNSRNRISDAQFQFLDPDFSEDDARTILWAAMNYQSPQNRLEQTLRNWLNSQKCEVYLSFYENNFGVGMEGHELSILAPSDSFPIPDEKRFDRNQMVEYCERESQNAKDEKGNQRFKLFLEQLQWIPGQENQHQTHLEYLSAIVVRGKCIPKSKIVLD